MGLLEIMLNFLNLLSLIFFVHLGAALHAVNTTLTYYDLKAYS